MDEKKIKNAGRFQLVPNLCARFQNLKKMKNEKLGGPIWTLQSSLF
jgi:hypothetical protein